MTRIAIFLLFAALAQAQNETAQLSAWRWKAGDNATWQNADLDDSGWASGPGPIRKPEHARFDEVIWFRLSLDMPAPWKGQDLAIGIGPWNGEYQLFVNGAEVGRHGALPPAGSAIDQPGRAVYGTGHRTFAVPSAAVPAGRVTIAFRVSFSRHTVGASADITGRGSSPHLPTIGLARTIEQGELLHTFDAVVEQIPNTILWTLVLACGIACLALYRRDRSETELLWLGLALTFNGGVRWAALPVNIGQVPLNSLYAFIALWGLFYAVHFFYCWLLADLLPAIRRAVRAAAFVIAFGAMLALLDRFVPVHLDNTVITVTRNFALLAEAALAVAAIAYWARARRWDFSALGLGVFSRAIATYYAFGSLNQFMFGGLVVDATAAANMVVALSLIVILYIRSRHRAARRREAEQDRAAAARVQSALLSPPAPHPFFTLDVVYQPAREVGGDFYKTESLSDGSVLVIVGDVSGKGLKAAMIVSLVIGVLANRHSDRPAELVGELNRTLCGRLNGAFVTCCILRVDASGSAVIANAGNPPPWLDGVELETAGGLPLGIAEDAAYTEVIQQLGSDGQLAFVSDGVVEAANGKGELFGFDRARSISTKPAQQIAEAARSWGQNDDITVVTVRRNPW